MAPALTRHRWTDLVMGFWRFDEEALGAMLPPGTRPDIVDGSAWAVLQGYVFRETTIPPLPPPGDFGTLTELTIEILTVDDAGRRGTSYRTIETNHLFAIAAARIGIGVPYRAARVRTRRRDERIEHRSRRVLGTDRGATLTIEARPAAEESPLPAFVEQLAHREGIHARHLGLTTFWERDHPALALRSASMRVVGDLPSRVGMAELSGRAPDVAVVAGATVVEYRWGALVRA